MAGRKTKPHRANKHTLETHESQTTTEIWQNLQSILHQGLQTTYPIAQTTKTQKIDHTHEHKQWGTEEEKQDIEEKQKKIQAIQKQIEQQDKHLTRSGKVQSLLKFLHAWKQITQNTKNQDREQRINKTKTIRDIQKKKSSKRQINTTWANMRSAAKMKRQKTTTRSPNATKSS